MGLSKRIGLLVCRMTTRGEARTKGRDPDGSAALPALPWSAISCKNAICLSAMQKVRWDEVSVHMPCMLIADAKKFAMSRDGAASMASLLL